MTTQMDHVCVCVCVFVAVCVCVCVCAVYDGRGQTYSPLITTEQTKGL